MGQTLSRCARIHRKHDVDTILECSELIGKVPLTSNPVLTHDTSTPVAIIRSQICKCSKRFITDCAECCIAQWTSFVDGVEWQCSYGSSSLALK